MASEAPSPLLWHVRSSRIEGALLRTLADAGYTRVYVPMFASLEGYADRLGDEVRTEYVTFALGGEQVLRPEFTTSVCRLVLAEPALRDAAGPLRLAYAGQTFRVHRGHTVFPHERRQVGGELVGAPAPDGDREVLRLLAALAAALGAPRWTLSLGHASLLTSALVARGATSEQAARVRRDLHRIRRHAERLRTGDTLLADVLPRLLGARARRAGNDDVLRGASDLGVIERRVVREEWRRAGVPQSAVALLDELEAVRDDAGDDADRMSRALEAAVGGAVRAPLAELRAARAALAEEAGPLAVTIDPTASRDLSYYTGMLFELRPADGGPPLGGGGRYDRFFTAVGGPEAGRPAIGFALDVGRIERTLPVAGVERPESGPGSEGRDP